MNVNMTRCTLRYQTETCGKTCDKGNGLSAEEKHLCPLKTLTWLFNRKNKQIYFGFTGKMEKSRSADRGLSASLGYEVLHVLKASLLRYPTVIRINRMSRAGPK